MLNKSGSRRKTIFFFKLLVNLQILTNGTSLPEDSTKIHKKSTTGQENNAGKDGSIIWTPPKNMANGHQNKIFRSLTC